MNYSDVFAVLAITGACMMTFFLWGQMDCYDEHRHVKREIKRPERRLYNVKGVK